MKTKDAQQNEPSDALHFGQVLGEELRVVRERRQKRLKGFRGYPSSIPTGMVKVVEGEGEEPGDRALASDLAGMAFSGGGIRSATFNLGVLQGLANLGLLPYFDYLSTVSGGGYIGSWLTALLKREPGGVFEVQNRLRTTRVDDVAGEDEDGGAGEQEVADSTGPEGAGKRVEDEAVHWLRSYSNYLTPKVGLLTADTWAVVTTYVRNLVLNLTILIAALGVLLLLPRLAVWSAGAVDGSDWLLAVSIFLSTAAVLVMGLHMASFSRPSGSSGGERASWWLTQDGVQLAIVLPMVVAAVCSTAWLMEQEEQRAEASAVLFAVAWLGAWLLAWVVAKIAIARARRKSKASPDEDFTAKGQGWGRLVVGGVFAAPLSGLVILAAFQLFGQSDSDWLKIALGPSIILIGFLLTAAFQIGFAGRKIHDYQREWLSRLAAWLVIYSVAWVAVFLVVMYGPVLILWSQAWIRATLTAGWVATTLAGLLASRGKSGSAGALRAWIARVAPYVFIGGLLMLLALGLDAALSNKAWNRVSVLSGAEMDESFWSVPETVEAEHRARLATARVVEHWTGVEGPVEGPDLLGELVWAHWNLLESPDRPWRALLLALALLAVLGFQGWRIDINEFSMHRLYRNRLVRCYLGASVKQRAHQKFTGFANDDILIEGLEEIKSGPFHILNTALNLVGGQDLAWQERKAASFVFTPLYSGFQRSESEGGYRKSCEYGSDPKKLTLGSAVAISGAAASPNMGFRTSAAFSFLLAVFNVRLGWWIGNPWRKDKYWRRSGPWFSVLNLFAEVIGKTQDDRRYVYLSDGGHFENLGIYELVRRRCRFILASDAGADPTLSFEDLGNAIRKCRTDFGVEIRLRTGELSPGEDGRSRWHCAVGTIDYGGGRPKGTLVYIKPTLTGDEPEDVLNYASDHAAFPHESTGDQWFDEGQFESYRRLGIHVAEEVLGAEARHAAEAAESAWRRDAGTPASGSQQEPPDRRPLRISFEWMVDRLRERWHPPSRAISGAFSRHGEMLEKLFERLRNDQDLAFLDAQFYPEWPSLTQGGPTPKPPEWLPWGDEDAEKKLREGFYFCNSLIQLMENVYLDLELQQELEHPDNRGWLNLFKHWSWSGMFQATWAISASTYGRRFQDFCESRLGLGSVSRVSVEPVGSAEGAEALSNKGLAKAFEGSQQLNFHERDVIAAFLGEEGNEVREVWEVRVTIENPFGEKGDLYFGCGFALISKGTLVCYRIQDHLRRVGLGRAGLRELYRLERIGGGVRPGRIPAAHLGDFTAAGRRQLAELYRSVQRELEEEGGAEALAGSLARSSTKPPGKSSSSNTVA